MSIDRAFPRRRAEARCSPTPPGLVNLAAPDGELAFVVFTRRGLLQKGGDPTAGSPTVTLLRLHPSYQSLFRRLPPEG